METIERALGNSGWEPETCTTDDDGPGRRNGKPTGVPLLENGVRRRYFAKRTDLYKVSPSLARWLSRHVCDYDVVHIHAVFSFSSTAAAHYARVRGVPYVVRPLGTLNQWGLQHHRALPKRLSIAAIEGKMLARAAAVHFTSEREQAETQQLGLAFESVVIPLATPSAPTGGAGPEPILCRHPQLRGAQRVLFLSRLHPKKNLEGLLQALALCAARLPQAALLVAGAGEAHYELELRKAAHALGIEDRVVWAGHLEGELKASAFACADVFVLPSFSENFGIAAAEALAAGVPCILAEGVALSEAAAACGAAVRTQPGAEALASEIAALLADRERAEALRVRGRVFAQEHLSVRRLGDDLANLYSRILARARAAAC
jgi:glycosyltransferase involved in cell wall biosynthesis